MIVAVEANGLMSLDAIARAHRTSTENAARLCAAHGIPLIRLPRGRYVAPEHHFRVGVLIDADVEARNVKRDKLAAAKIRKRIDMASVYKALIGGDIIRDWEFDRLYGEAVAS